MSLCLMALVVGKVNLSSRTVTAARRNSTCKQACFNSFSLSLVLSILDAAIHCRYLDVNQDMSSYVSAVILN